MIAASSFDGGGLYRNWSLLGRRHFLCDGVIKRTGPALSRRESFSAKPRHDLNLVEEAAPTHRASPSG